MNSRGNRLQSHYGTYGSLAYDYGSFGCNNAGEYSGSTAQKQKKKIKCRAGVSPALVVSCALCLVIVLTALMRSSEITVLSAEVHSLRQEIEELRDEQTKLKIEHALAFSPEETEKYAREVLGMIKPGPQQIYYIELGEIPPEDDTNDHGGEEKTEYFIREYFRG